MRTTLFLWLYLVCCVSTATPIKIQDDANRTVSLPQAAQRIVSLAPHITELLFAVGAGDRIIGTVTYSDYPEQAKQIPRIGSYDRVNFERILALKPDLIIGWMSGNDADTIQHLQHLDIPVYLSEPKDLDSIEANIRKLGQLTQTQTQANREADAFAEKRQSLYKQHAHKKPIRIFYQVWEDPLYTLGGGHFSIDMFKLCGGVNIFNDLEKPAPIVNLEAVISRNPQVMLTGDHHGKRSIDNWRETWQQWPKIDAVRHNLLFFVNQDIYTRSSPRALQAADHLCQLLDQAREVYY